MDSDLVGRIIEDSEEARAKIQEAAENTKTYLQLLSSERLPDKLPPHEEPPEPAFINWLCERFKTRDYEEIKRRIDKIYKVYTKNPYVGMNGDAVWNDCAYTIKEIMEGMDE